MRLKDFSACVMVDGVELKEYGVTADHSDPEHKITCWIASEEGKKFAVQWKCWSCLRKDASSGKVTVDGIQCKGKIIRPSSKHDTRCCSCFSDSTGTRDFLFSRVQLTDDESYLDHAVSEQLGEIRLKIVFGRAGGRIERKDDLPVPPSEEKIHERSKKVISHRVGFAELVKHDGSRSLTSFCENNVSPLVFVFKYRPLEILQANGIAPLIPAVNPKAPPDALDGDVKIQEGTDIDANIMALENKLKRLRSQKEASLKTGPQAKRVKTEIKAEEASTLHEYKPITPREVIDLT
ncbi:hypothetical protein BJ138DRAFT_1116488 [Hygrophoropsis aurantiaca]|uniref:Uncharacterized protein n=1 Tax=Hygrophoropsis aurantiaca TaxID=72124 RepID=A0ACB8A3W2_9AGAM|nr:hypothetical protein BJ138DRAFT_1116488 [Hygrophoropsis aurantiaca]